MAMPANHATARTARAGPKTSGTRTPSVPTLAQMIRDGQTDAIKHKQRSRDALAYWFRQSERLNIARTHHRLRGPRFSDFARRIGIDRSSAFEIVKLQRHRAAIEARCLDEQERAAERGEMYFHPGWEAALAWFEKGRSGSGRFWLTPPSLYQSLDDEFHFDFDPCPCPLPDGWDGLKIAWGKSNFVNAPFRKSDGPGLTTFVRRAIAEQQHGKSSVLIIPTVEAVDLLVTAGAEIRPLGRVPFLDADTGEEWRNPVVVTCFILRGKSPRSAGVRQSVPSRGQAVKPIPKGVETPAPAKPKRAGGAPAAKQGRRRA
jgi:hypothetical protein